MAMVDPTLSFKCFRPVKRSVLGKMDELTVERVIQAHFKAFIYTCEISKNKKLYLQDFITTAQNHSLGPKVITAQRLQSQ